MWPEVLEPMGARVSGWGQLISTHHPILPLAYGAKDPWTEGQSCDVAELS